MTSEAVKVIVRCRPLNQREKDLKCETVVSMESSRGQCSIVNPSDSKAPPKSFFFDGAYFTDSTTDNIYADIAYPLVEGVTEGYNGTIFAYGQTGCGKSFSMQGITDPPSQRGIIPRAFDHIFETISVAQSSKFLVHASYLEIYNEEIRDLLGKDVKARLDLKEHPEKGVYVSGLSMHKVTNVSECQVVMERGWKNRATGATLMNADSSRSHSIFTIYLECAEWDDQGEEHIRAGKLNLVDLAGSERQSKTGATGDRLKEATKINLSLSALGNVISALVDGKSKHIPYRDSKLTRLLQDSLGGNTKTLMVACLSPADNNYDETLSTLRYANRAKNIQNKPKINEDPKDALLRQYQEEIEKLKAILAGHLGDPSQLAALLGGAAAAGQQQKSPVRQRRGEAVDDDDAKHREVLEAEREKLRLEYEEKLKAKEAAYAVEAADRVKLQEDINKLKSYYDSKLAQLEDSVASPDEAVSDFNRGNSADEMYIGDNGAPVQQAVHLKSRPTTSAVAKQQTTNSPQQGPELQDDGAVQEEVLKRLQALESGMVGGELKNDDEVRERHKKKKRHAEERKRKLLAANSQMEDGGLMVGIYESMQGDLKSKEKQLSRQQQRTEALEREILDLQSEFESDRMDYLDTIRKQERQLLLYQTILDRIQPCIRRDSNYYYLDRIRRDARWDDEKGMWLLPPLQIEKTSLPSAVGNGGPVGGGSGSAHSNANGQRGGYQDEEDYFEDDRLYQKMHARQGEAKYFQSGRADRIIAETRAAEASTKLLSRRERNSFSGYTSLPMTFSDSSVVSLPGQQQQMSSPEARAAFVHGGGMGGAEDMGAGLRRPSRLESLPPPPRTAGKSRRKQRDGFY
ncbi:hypothetical protein BOX15_Mlig016377g1 [Macrostomum lignano]|uniref:Kinesin-like protein n=1 Tax=Macrostomum lignano TaxID=282301 RepID=A0A267GIS3_9PLAT|nr:hypothetical protein BOX15_Mlig016377g1 [Macrostomum lignano]